MTVHKRKVKINAMNNNNNNNNNCLFIFPLYSTSIDSDRV